ncbi:indoleamine 2,3-dioxygenase [Geosmithia morbida]|uniref:Indoleamine 2,3-dioxygenase n=1 Tax=Geosmithia morbida TaxID=1094350 RepID=A0A9P4YYG9_9HYPO|nr:indoleamine 2,3-dioxygenase [Geosmithia morbida]KAF4124827.1 indoleamine 2,3-dioxygenase [Geosmithia morbida]
MSPHATCPESRQLRSKRYLEEFAITRHAFLPEESPAVLLSHAYYDPWESVARQLPQLIDSGGIRQAVSLLPVLSTDYLASESEWRRAYCLLAYTAHAHIWGGDKPEEILPPQITVPFLAVSSHLEVPPVLTYAGANLWNFSSTSDDFTDLGSLQTLFSFTGTESEAWFLLISVAMEAKGAGIIDTMTAAISAVKTRDYGMIIHALEELQDCIRGVGVLLERMYERCDPMIFYHRIRPFLAGSKNMGAAGLPSGVFYDEGDGKGEWLEYRGGSNGQSSLIQFFDIVLGIDHKGHGNTQSSFHAEVREYMPGPHRRFLLHVARLGSIRELALLPPVTEEQHRLQETYTAATEALSEFRDKHIKIVTRYIVLPSKKPWQGTGRKNLASSSSGMKGSTNLTGTGGTSLMPFLKHSRDETKAAGQLNSSGWY